MVIKMTLAYKLLKIPGNLDEFKTEVKRRGYKSVFVQHDKSLDMEVEGYFLSTEDGKVQFLYAYENPRSRRKLRYLERKNSVKSKIENTLNSAGIETRELPSYYEQTGNLLKHILYGGPKPISQPHIERKRHATFKYFHTSSIHDTIMARTTFN